MSLLSDLFGDGSPLDKLQPPPQWTAHPTTSKWPPRHAISTGDLPQIGMLVLAYWHDSFSQYEAAKLDDDGDWTIYDGEWGCYMKVSAPDYWWKLPLVEGEA